MSKSCCDNEQGKTSKSHFTIGLLGNPNCGKSTLFNQLTGSRQRIGNWPGVTVDRKVGQFKFNNINFDIVDLPGVYSLDNSARSLDEKITRDYILSSEPDVIINLIDASNLERNLYLSGQLLEMQVPMVLVLNMMDVADSHGLIIDTETLAEKFGCPVVAIVASKKLGIQKLEQTILEVAQETRLPSKNLPYLPQIEHAIGQLLENIPKDEQCMHVDCRWMASQILDGDTGIRDFKVITPEVLAQAAQLRREIELELKEDIDILLADCRYGFAREVTDASISRPDTHRHSISDHIDRVVLNRYLGIPIFLAGHLHDVPVHHQSGWGLYRFLRYDGRRYIC